MIIVPFLKRSDCLKKASMLIMMLLNPQTSNSNQSASSSNYSNASTNSGSSVKFFEDEIDAAISSVKEKFKDFEGCDLTDIWYDESQSNLRIQNYIKNHVDVDAENAIVLLSNFKVDDSGKDGSFEPNSIYTDWCWILVRESKTDNWKVVDWGYDGDIRSQI